MGVVTVGEWKGVVALQRHPRGCVSRHGGLPTWRRTVQSGRVGVVTVTTYVMLMGTYFLVPAALAEGLSQALANIDLRAAVLILFLGICGGAIGYLLWTSALAYLTPTQVAVYVNLNPMVATTLGAAVLAEKLTPVFIVCFVAVLIGVLLVNWPAKPPVPTSVHPAGRG
ncbi:MAG: DMT family transporter [Thermodesulfobacteriota bacterium]